jgi:hypothetical protein
MSDESGAVVLNLTADEARQLYDDIVHMDESWQADGPYSSIREKLERQL